MDGIIATYQSDFASAGWLILGPIVGIILTVGICVVWIIGGVRRWRRGEKLAIPESIFIGLSWVVFLMPKSLYLLNLFPPGARAACLTLFLLCLLLGAAVMWLRWRQLTARGQRATTILLAASYSLLLLVGFLQLVVPDAMGTAF